MQATTNNTGTVQLIPREGPTRAVTITLHDAQRLGLYNAAVAEAGANVGSLAVPRATYDDLALTLPLAFDCTSAWAPSKRFDDMPIGVVFQLLRTADYLGAVDLCTHGKKWLAHSLQRRNPDLIDTLTSVFPVTADAPMASVDDCVSPTRKRRFDDDDDEVGRRLPAPSTDDLLYPGAISAGFMQEVFAQLKLWVYKRLSVHPAIEALWGRRVSFVDTMSLWSEDATSVKLACRFPDATEALCSTKGDEPLQEVLSLLQHVNLLGFGKVDEPMVNMLSQLDIATRQKIRTIYVHKDTDPKILFEALLLFPNLETVRVSVSQFPLRELVEHRAALLDATQTPPTWCQRINLTSGLMLKLDGTDSQQLCERLDAWPSFNGMTPLETAFSQGIYVPNELLLPEDPTVDLISYRKPSCGRDSYTEDANGAMRGTLLMAVTTCIKQLVGVPQPVVEQRMRQCATLLQAIIQRHGEGGAAQPPLRRPDVPKKLRFALKHACSTVGQIIRPSTRPSYWQETPTQSPPVATTLHAELLLQLYRCMPTWMQVEHFINSAGGYDYEEEPYVHAAERLVGDTTHQLTVECLTSRFDAPSDAYGSTERLRRGCTWWHLVETGLIPCVCEFAKTLPIDVQARIPKFWEANEHGETPLMISFELLANYEELYSGFPGLLEFCSIHPDDLVDPDDADEPMEDNVGIKTTHLGYVKHSHEDHPDMAKILGAVDNEGRSVFHYTLVCEFDKLVKEDMNNMAKQLFRCCCNIRDHHGRTPLHLMLSPTGAEKSTFESVLSDGNFNPFAIPHELLHYQEIGPHSIDDLVCLVTSKWQALLEDKNTPRLFLRLLLRAGPAVRSWHDANGNNLAHLLVTNKAYPTHEDHTHRLKWLATAGVSLTTPNADGWTPLQLSRLTPMQQNFLARYKPAKATGDVLEDFYKTEKANGRSACMLYEWALADNWGQSFRALDPAAIKKRLDVLGDATKHRLRKRADEKLPSGKTAKKVAYDCDSEWAVETRRHYVTDFLNDLGFKLPL